MFEAQEFLSMFLVKQQKHKHLQIDPTVLLHRCSNTLLVMKRAWKNVGGGF